MEYSKVQMGPVLGSATGVLDHDMASNYNSIKSEYLKNEKESWIINLGWWWEGFRKMPT